MKIIIDNGHGAGVKGKCSPDGRLQEWRYNRELARAIGERLDSEGFDTEMLVPETRDVAIGERIRRVNAIAVKEEAVLISVHVNAAASQGWHGARGWSAIVSPGASELSRRLARAMTAEAAGAGLVGNRRSPPEGYWQMNLAMCSKTRCPAVLTENMFMDNREDLAFLLSNRAIDILTDVHVNAIKALIKI